MNDSHYQPNLWGEDPKAYLRTGLLNLIRAVEKKRKYIRETLERFEREPVLENSRIVNTKSMGRVRVDGFNRRARRIKTSTLLQEQKLLTLWSKHLTRDLESGAFRPVGYRLPWLSICFSLAPEEWLARGK